MNASEDSYRRICDDVWALYQAQVEKEKPRRSKRRGLPPPPVREKPVDLLFVGISPSQIAPIGYATDRPRAERLVREFEYVSASGKRGSKLSNDAYYEPLVQFAQRLDSRFGVAPQVARGEKSLLVEFTAALDI